MVKVYSLKTKGYRFWKRVQLSFIYWGSERASSCTLNCLEFIVLMAIITRNWHSYLIYCHTIYN